MGLLLRSGYGPRAGVPYSSRSCRAPLGLTAPLQDQLLNWFRGIEVASPPQMLFLSLHTARPAVVSNEVSARFGGRIVIAAADLGEPETGIGGLREVRNLRALISQPANEKLRLEAIGIWSDASGGLQLLSGIIEPGLVVERGDPAVFLTGDVRLRATA